MGQIIADFNSKYLCDKRTLALKRIKKYSIYNKCIAGSLILSLVLFDYLHFVLLVDDLFQIL